MHHDDRSARAGVSQNGRLMSRHAVALIAGRKTISA
jgi:hypothetical protein